MTAETIDPTASRIAARDRARRARAFSLSPAERLAAMRRLLEQARTILERHPEGLAHFWRRNFAARSIGRSAAACANDS
jgi:hypothetical protein